MVVQIEIGFGIARIKQPGEVAQHALPQLRLVENALVIGLDRLVRLVVGQAVQQRWLQAHHRQRFALRIATWADWRITHLHYSFSSFGGINCQMSNIQ